MIKWNIDPTEYSKEQLEELFLVVEKMDRAIASQLSDYLDKIKNNDK